MMLKESQGLVTFIARNDSNPMILIKYTYVHMEFGSFQALIVTDTLEGTVMIRFFNDNVQDHENRCCNYVKN